MPPKVSILLPNLNNRPYLDERLQSIWAQTFSDWELIVVDSHSSDGAWEFFCACAEKDSRIKVFQSDKRGIYVNFNTCIRLAQGEYVYFATSDDSMSSLALATFVAALDTQPDCDLAHCKLQIIDENGRLSEHKHWDDFFIVQYFGDWINQPHIRRAPHDGILHFSGISVYTSLTQLMLRRSVFAKIGFFLEDYGHTADYEWVMRATLTVNTIHIPLYLAAWRFHENQATNDKRLADAKAAGRFIKMAHHALKMARKYNPEPLQKLNQRQLFTILKKEKLYYALKNCRSEFWRYLILLRWLITDHALVWELKQAIAEHRSFVCQSDFLATIKKMITEHKLERNLVTLAKK